MICIPRQLLLLLTILAAFSTHNCAQEIPLADTANDSESITFHDTLDAGNEQDQEDDNDQEVDVDLAGRIIHDIIVEGNQQVSTQAILNKIPYRVGQTFDPIKTRELINNLYYDFKRFRTVTVMADPLDPE